MYIYRVEHVKTGLGPYKESRTQPVLERSLMNHTNSWEHPTLINEFFADDRYNPLIRFYFCGFTTIEALVQWFREELTIFATLQDTFHIVCYTVQDGYVRKGALQCIFIKDRATCIDTFTFNELAVLLQK